MGFQNETFSCPGVKPRFALSVVAGLAMVLALLVMPKADICVTLKILYKEARMAANWLYHLSRNTLSDTRSSEFQISLQTLLLDQQFIHC